MKVEWTDMMDRIDHVSINTVMIHRYWGPSTIVTPSTCDSKRKVEKEYAGAKQLSKDDPSWVLPVEGNKVVTGAALSGGLNFQEKNSSTPIGYPTDGRSILDERRLGLDSDSFQRFAADLELRFFDMLGLNQSQQISIETCSKQLDFKSPSNWNQYFSMIVLGLAAGCEPSPTMERFRLRRERLSFHFKIWLLVCWIMKFGTKLIDFLSQACGHRYVQLWNGGRSGIDRALETLIVHSLTTMFMLALQLASCSCFLTFWEDDYFLLAHIPAVGFSLFFITLVFMTLFITIDRVLGVMDYLSNWYVYLFWTFYLIWFALLAVPMLGSCVYSLQFLVEIQKNGLLLNGLSNFSEDYQWAATIAVSASAGFLFTATFDVVVMIMSDCGKTVTPGKVDDVSLETQYLRQISVQRICE
jgi:hypothetical protein